MAGDADLPPKTLDVVAPTKGYMLTTCRMSKEERWDQDDDLQPAHPQSNDILVEVLHQFPPH